MQPGNDFWDGLDSLLAERSRAGLARQRRSWTPISARLIADSSGCELVNFGSNDYLSLSWHPAVAQAAARSNLRAGSGASPLVTGASHDYQALVRALVDFEQTEDALLFSSGYATNIGTVSALATKDDVIFSDQLNHASLIDGCRLSRAKVYVYRHNDIEHLEQLIRKHRTEGKYGFVVTDSIFSMDGDLALLTCIKELCEEFDMMSIVDEAHATGIYGCRGTGLIEELGLASHRWVRTGTLSKAVGCVGGFVAGPRVLIEFLTNFARSFIYSTALPSAVLRQARCSIELIESMSEERLRLRGMASQLRFRLADQGLRVGGGDSPIIAVYCGLEQVVRWSDSLRKSGLFVPAIRPPTVPVNGCLLRISLNTSHSQSDLERLVSACRF